MAQHFANLLRHMRQDRGFHSAYAFYHDNGGRRVFPFTYTYYSKIEKGKALPRPAWLPVLFASLRLPPAAGTQRDFVAAYLRDVFGDDRLFDDLVMPWLKPAHPQPIQKKALRRLLGRMSRNLTQEQFGAIVSSPAAFWGFLCLSKSREPMSVADLARVADLSEPQVEAGLKVLTGRKLAKRGSDGRFTSPLLENYSVFPRHGHGHDERMRRLNEYVERATEKRGGQLVSRRGLIRAEESDMLGVAHALHEALEGAHGCAVEDAGHRTGLYFVETRLQRIFPF